MREGLVHTLLYITLLSSDELVVEVMWLLPTLLRITLADPSLHTFACGGRMYAAVFARELHALTDEV